MAEEVQGYNLDIFLNQQEARNYLCVMFVPYLNSKAQNNEK